MSVLSREKESVPWSGSSAGACHAGLMAIVSYGCCRGSSDDTYPFSTLHVQYFMFSAQYLKYNEIFCSSMSMSWE